MNLSTIKNIISSVFPWDKGRAEVDLYKNYNAKAKENGVDGLYVFFSFDCDTDLDGPAALELQSLLKENDISATYAVPGVQLERDPNSYRKIHNLGGEFMNHGYLPHAEWNGVSWEGRTFYNEMLDQDVIDDISYGHQAVVDIIGVKPKGFRAPHFGCYQSPSQISLMHSQARKLGYQYSSSTLPSYAFQHGPIHQVSNGFIEIPCYGNTSSPTTILDSWTFLEDKINYRLSDDYYDLFSETIEILMRKKAPALLTWYVDPAHVVGQMSFEKSMSLLKSHNVRSLLGSEVVTTFTRNFSG